MDGYVDLKFTTPAGHCATSTLRIEKPMASTYEGAKAQIVGKITEEMVRWCAEEILSCMGIRRTPFNT